MKNRQWLTTLLTVLPLATFPACLQYPDKLPNPDEVDATQADVVDDTADDTDTGDVVQDTGDVEQDTFVDAADAVDSFEVDVVEPCMEGDGCDDGDPCTVEDQCDAAGNCAGTFVAECDDSIECTDDSCSSAFDCTHAVKAGFCFVAGVCYVADALDVEKYGPCVSCKPDILATAMSADDTLTCDDASLCTEDDHCSGGICTGTGVVCNDSNPCTTDSCVPATGCATENNVDICSTARCEGMMFYPAAICSGGICPTITPEDCDDDNPCTTDQCKVTGCTHTPRNGQVCIPGACELGTFYQASYCINDFCPPQESTFCDDENICTEDYCSPEGGCLTRNDNTKVCGQASCDGMTFRPQVVCNNGLCPTQIPRNCADTNICTDDECTLSGCTNVGNNAPCTDNNPCTLNDVCQTKVCRSGSLKPCDDGLDCTSDSCDTGTGECAFTNLGYCIIGGACWSDGDLNPENTCEKCAVATKLDDWSPGQENSVCDDYPDGSALCISGACSYDCNLNRGDCDGDYLNGCETNLLNDPDYCGDCYTDCGTQVCSWGICADTCAGDLELCDGRCEDVTTSIRHCGTCNNSCERDNAIVECNSSNCVITGCDEGYVNVDLDPDNGCECANTGLELCDGIDNDCNGGTDDVAIELLQGDPTNCGQCGKICNTGDRWSHGYCTSGSCVEVPCQPNLFDLNKDPLDGCEYDCVFQGSEICGNSVDEDCTGSTDDGC